MLFLEYTEPNTGERILRQLDYVQAQNQGRLAIDTDKLESQVSQLKSRIGYRHVRLVWVEAQELINRGSFLPDHHPRAVPGRKVVEYRYLEDRAEQLEQREQLLERRQNLLRHTLQDAAESLGEIVETIERAERDI